jgi:outer membrane protein TolC
MKHLFLTILWILTAILRGYSQQEVSLQNCIEAAQQHQPLARQQPLIEAAGQAALEQLRTGWWPQATLNGQATWQSDVTALPIRLPNFEVPSISQDQYRLTLDLLQPLWDGGQVQHQSNLQKAQTLIEQQRLQTEQYAVKEQVIQLYCAALLAQQQKEVLTTLQKDVRSRKTRAEEQVSNGVAIPMAVQAFSVRLLEMEQQADELESRKTAALEGLRLLTGLPLSANDRFSLENPGDNKNATASARPEIRLFALQQNGTLEQEQLARTKMMPRVNAIATLGYARPGLNFLSNDFSHYAIVGANFRWNLNTLYNGSVQKERQQYRLQSERIAAQRDQFLLQTSVREQQQQQEIKRLEKVLQTDAAIVELREKMASTAAVQLENGVLTPTEYLTETTQTAQARLQTALHEIQLLQARMLLRYVTGQL